MESWDINKRKNIKTPEKVINFLNEIDNICKKYNLYIEEVVKTVTHDKEMIILHTIIKEQKRRMDEIKELIKYASDCDSPTIRKILKVLEE